MIDWGEPLPDARRDALVRAVTQRIARRKMETPALLFLEMHRPLAFLGSQGLIAFSAFLGPLVGAERVGDIARFLSVPGNVDLLIASIEEALAHRLTPPVETGPGLSS